MASLTAWVYDRIMGATDAEVWLKDLQERGALTVHDAITLTWFPGAEEPQIGHLRHRTAGAAAKGSLIGGLLGILVFNPVAGAMRRAERRMHDATEKERASRAELERAREALRQQENERDREDQRWRAARQQVVAEMLELQNYARTLMASKKGNPSVTDGLTGSAFYPLFTPANEVVPGEEAPPEMRPFTPTVPEPSPNGDHR